jgi:hypothetical protein
LVRHARKALLETLGGIEVIVEAEDSPLEALASNDLFAWRRLAILRLVAGRYPSSRISHDQHRLRVDR